MEKIQKDKTKKRTKISRSQMRKNAEKSLSNVPLKIGIATECWYCMKSGIVDGESIEKFTFANGEYTKFLHESCLNSMFS